MPSFRITHIFSTSHDFNVKKSFDWSSTNVVTVIISKENKEISQWIFRLTISVVKWIFSLIVQNGNHSFLSCYRHTDWNCSYYENYVIGTWAEPVKGRISKKKSVENSILQLWIKIWISFSKHNPNSYFIDLQQYSIHICSMNWASFASNSLVLISCGFQSKNILQLATYLHI